MVQKLCKETNWKNVPLILTVKQISNIFGFGEEEVRKMMRREDFPAIDYGAGTRVDKTAFRVWLRERRIKDF